MKVLVTAGPTREYLDPVRFLSNPSSGKMGYAIAEEAAKRGYAVTLVSGPTTLTAPHKRIRFIPVVSAADMYRVVMHEAARTDLIVMAAAVSDYRPATFSRKKLKKTGKRQTLTLVPTQDILHSLGQRKRAGQILVGFAAETDRLVPNAMKKLRSKRLDWIVANMVGRPGTGFGSDFNRALLIPRSGKIEKLPLLSKRKLASRIIERIFKKVPR